MYNLIGKTESKHVKRNSDKCNKEVKDLVIRNMYSVNVYMH